MVDYTKWVLLGIDPNELEENSLLDFRQSVSRKTGELEPKYIAYYKNLKFVIFDGVNTNRRITLEGSLHVFYNYYKENKRHNYNDFGLKELYEVLKFLNEKFKIDPANCILKSLEIGMNINPLTQTKRILENCIIHKTKPFKWQRVQNEGKYIIAEHQRYFIKAYDKRIHYLRKGFEIKEEIFRFEIKYVKMHDLNDKGIYTFNDLLEYGFNAFLEKLIQEWNNVLFYEDSIFDDTKYKFIYSNPKFWKELKPSNFKYHRSQMNNAIDAKEFCLKKNIEQLLQLKADYLLK